MIVLCNKCHHEWQQFDKNPRTCDWCGCEDSEVLDLEKDYGICYTDEDEDILRKLGIYRS